MRNIDIPPVWLAAFLAAAWAAGRLMPVDWAFGRLAGAILVGLGLAILLAAAVQMMAQRTTLHPHGDPAALVTGGLFAVSRNPIYLADVLVLLGACLWFRAALALPLVALFMWLVARRFIAPEEARLSARFGPAFDAYRRRVRRWI